MISFLQILKIEQANMPEKHFYETGDTLARLNAAKITLAR